MNQRILGRGVIACSAVVVTQWLPSFGVKLPANICQRKNDLKPVSPSSPARTGSFDQCSIDEMLSLVEGLPEQFKLQWSQGNSPQVPPSMEREYRELISQAQTMASHNQIAEAISLVATIPKNTRHYELAHQLLETWSQEILHQAMSSHDQANLPAALKQLEAIPVTSSQYPQVTQLKRQWQQEAAQLHQAIVAGKAGRWQEVADRLETFRNTPLFQSLPVQELLQIAMTKMLEPDPTLLQIASTMDSTQFRTASIPAPPNYSASESFSVSRYRPQSVSSSVAAVSSFDSEPDQGISSSVNSLLTAKLTKSDRLAVLPQPAPLKPEDVSMKMGQFGSSPFTHPAIDKLAYAQ